MAERRLGYSIAIPLNDTMLRKSAIDAPLKLREALAAYGVHDYSTQTIGTTVSAPLTLHAMGDSKQEEARFTRPNTHGGRFNRIWITGCRRVARPGDVLSIEIGSDSSMSAAVSEEVRRPATRPRGVDIGPDVRAHDFSGYGGGRRLVELLREHVLIVMGGIVECAPGHFMGASVAEINDAADLSLDIYDRSRALVKAVLASLVRSGHVHVQKRGNVYHYTLVRNDGNHT